MNYQIDYRSIHFSGLEIHIFVSVNGFDQAGGTDSLYTLTKQLIIEKSEGNLSARYA